MDIKKVVVIGPVYPFKGGIAHYTGLLCKELETRYDEVHVITYKMQYPKLLFKKEQKDYCNQQFKLESAKFWLNTANPFNIMAVANRIKKMAPDLIIIQWWHPYFAPCKMLKNLKKLFVCHNVFPHDSFPLDKFLTKVALKQGDFYIVQSKKDANDLRTIKLEPKYRIAVHPTYNIFNLHNLTKNEGRDILKLDLNEKIILFFGFIKPYKGLKYLLRAMRKVIETYSDCRLLVVGDFDSDKNDYYQIVSQLDIGNSVIFYDHYIPDTEIEIYFASCDLVALPYESATQSGIVQIAYGFNKPVIATNVGGLPEVVINNFTGYVVPPKDDEALAQAIVRFFKENKSIEFADEIQKQSYKYSWDLLLEKIEDIYYSENE